MTKQEFTFRQKAWKRSTGRIGAIGILCLFGVFGVMAFLDDYLQHHGWSVRIDSLMALAGVLLLAGGVPLAFWFTSRQYKRFGVTCPGCGRPLVGRAGEEAVATGSCRYCGEKIFSESDAA